MRQRQKLSPSSPSSVQQSISPCVVPENIHTPPPHRRFFVLHPPSPQEIPPLGISKDLPWVVYGFFSGTAHYINKEYNVRQRQKLSPSSLNIVQHLISPYNITTNIKQTGQENRGNDHQRFNVLMIKQILPTSIVWFQKISVPPPRKGLEIPEGWGGQGSRKFLKGGMVYK